MGNSVCLALIIADCPPGQFCLRSGVSGDSGEVWKSTGVKALGWETISFEDSVNYVSSNWKNAYSFNSYMFGANEIQTPQRLLNDCTKNGNTPETCDNNPSSQHPTKANFMWHNPSGDDNIDQSTWSTEAFFRYVFYLRNPGEDENNIDLTYEINAFMIVDDDYQLFVNGTPFFPNNDNGNPDKVDYYDSNTILPNPANLPPGANINTLLNYSSETLQDNKNVIAIHAVDGRWGNAEHRENKRVLFDSVISVSEPTSIILLLTGLFGLMWRHRLKA